MHFFKVPTGVLWLNVLRKPHSVPFTLAQYLKISLSSITCSLQRAFNLLWGVSCHFISILHSELITPWLPSVSTSLLAFRQTWLKLIVQSLRRWFWILWYTWLSLQCFETFSGTVPQLILLTVLMEISKSTCIMTFELWFIFKISRHCSNAINSAILLVALPKW